MNHTSLLSAIPLCPGRAVRAAVLHPANAATHATAFPTGMHETPPAEVDLAKNRLLALPPRRLKVLCVAGELWVTRDGDRRDYILGPGEALTLERGDRGAVQALRASRLRLSPA